MNISLRDDEIILVEGVQAFASKILTPSIERHVRDNRFPTDLVRAFGAAGFAGAAYPTEWGGSGFGVAGAALVAEVLATVEPGLAAIYLCNSAPMSLLSRYGSTELKTRWLAPLCRGETIASFGATETHGGSDVAGIRTRATEDGDHFVINGSKVFSTNAGTPLHGLSTIVAVTDPTAGAKGLSSFVVPVGTAGFSVGKPGHKIGWRIADSVELHFDDCRVPRSHLIGARGDGLRQILTTLSYGRILVAATALGLARRAVRHARDYGRDRTVAGKLLFEHQGLAFPLADILTKIHAAELMIRDAALLADAEAPFRVQSSMAKLFATELASHAASQAIQVHGGYGVFEDYAVSRLLGEAKVLEIVEGTSEIQRSIISRELNNSDSTFI